MRLLIVIINYNNSFGLKKTLQSISIQSNLNFIHTAIFDGKSTDNSLSIAKYFSFQLNLKIFSQVDNGIYNAMNNGLDYFSTLEYTHLIFLNSGDSLASDESLITIKNNITNNNDVYFFKTKNYYNEYYNFRPRSHIKKTFNERFDENYFPCHQAIVFPKEAISKLKFDESYKISADTVFIKEVFNNTTSHYIPIYIINFELGGISSFYKNITHFKYHYQERIRSKKIVNKIEKLSVFIKLFAKYLLCKTLGKRNYFRLYTKNKKG